MLNWTQGETLTSSPQTNNIVSCPACPLARHYRTGEIILGKLKGQIIIKTGLTWSWKGHGKSWNLKFEFQVWKAVEFWKMCSGHTVMEFQIFFSYTVDLIQWLISKQTFEMLYRTSTSDQKNLLPSPILFLVSGSYICYYSTVLYVL